MELTEREVDVTNENIIRSACFKLNFNIENNLVEEYPMEEMVSMLDELYEILMVQNNINTLKPN